MLSRFISKTPPHLRLLTLISSKPQCSKPVYPSSPNPNLPFILALSRSLSTSRNSGDDSAKDHSPSSVWKISPDDDRIGDGVFGEDQGSLAGIADGEDEDQPWQKEEGGEGDAFASVDAAVGAKGGGNEWATAEGYKAWTLGEEERDDHVFDIGELAQEEAAGGVVEDSYVETEKSEEEKRLEREEQDLKATLKGNADPFSY